MSKILEKSYKSYLSHVESQQVNLHTYEAMIDKEVFNLYEIDGDDLEQILREQGTPAGYFPIIEGFELIPDDMLPEAKDYIKNLQMVKLTPEKLNEMGEKLTELYEGGKTIEEIAVQMQINPVSVAAMRAEQDLINRYCERYYEIDQLYRKYITDSNEIEDSLEDIYEWIEKFYINYLDKLNSSFSEKIFKKGEWKLGRLPFPG